MTTERLRCSPRRIMIGRRLDMKSRRHRIKVWKLQPVKVQLDYRVGVDEVPSNVGCRWYLVWLHVSVSDIYASGAHLNIHFWGFFRGLSGLTFVYTEWYLQIIVAQRIPAESIRLVLHFREGITSPAFVGYSNYCKWAIFLPMNFDHLAAASSVSTASASANKLVKLGIPFVPASQSNRTSRQFFFEENPRVKHLSHLRDSNSHMDGTHGLVPQLICEVTPNASRIFHRRAVNWLPELREHMVSITVKFS